MEILKENNKNFAKKNRENMSQASYFSFNPFVPDPEHINGIDSYLLMIQAKMKDMYQTFTNYKKDWAMK